jgi:hypothetical protein
MIGCDSDVIGSRSRGSAGVDNQVDAVVFPPIVWELRLMRDQWARQPDDPKWPILGLDADRVRHGFLPAPHTDTCGYDTNKWGHGPGNGVPAAAAVGPVEDDFSPVFARVVRCWQGNAHIAAYFSHAIGRSMFSRWTGISGRERAGGLEAVRQGATVPAQAATEDADLHVPAFADWQTPTVFACVADFPL